MDAPPEVAAANAAARAMLRDHLRDYVERNGDDASYEAWIATVHPENVRLDDRLRLPQSEHRAMWDSRPRVTTATRQAGSGGGLVALLVGAVFAFAVYAAALAFIAARSPLFFGARALERLRFDRARLREREAEGRRFDVVGGGEGEQIAGAVSVDLRWQAR